jgi:hypothetical protein
MRWQARLVVYAPGNPGWRNLNWNWCQFIFSRQGNWNWCQFIFFWAGKNELTPIMISGAKEVVFETPWSQGKGLGSRKFDDFDFKTGTGFEANTTPWSQMTQEQLSRKLDQLASDFALLRTNPDVKRIVWFGTEELPTTGLRGQLRQALEQAGVPYWVIKP